MDIQEFDVVIVGAGPAGLSAALHLGQSGVRALVVERRSGFSRHPKANGVFSRTMEIYRQYGLSGTIIDGALPAEQSMGFAWLTRMNGYELGNIMFADSVEEAQTIYSVHSPEMPRFTPQDLLERMVAEAAESYPTVELRHETTAIALEQTADCVLVTMQRKDGSEYQVRARYLIGADGTRSTIRSLAGLTETTGNLWPKLLTIYFESEEFERLRKGRPYQLWFIVNGESAGAVWPVSYDNRWLISPFQIPGLSEKDYDDALCKKLVSGAAGQDVASEILNVNFYQIEEAIADNWRAGRVFLIGDAAHRFSPHGGYGMNSGVQDAHNLAWKLVLVLRGLAGDGLLDSYQDERKPVAAWNTEQTGINMRNAAETDLASPEMIERLKDIDHPELGKEIRERISAAVPLQRDTIHSQGQQFGATYRSSAIVGDGNEPPRSTVRDYRESGAPGARAPHLWVIDGEGRRFSLLDLFRLNEFTLLLGGKADADAWREAASILSSELAIGIACHAVGGTNGLIEQIDHRGSNFAELYDLGPSGAVLVRPDGYVGWRSKDGAARPLEELRRGILELLDLTGDEAVPTPSASLQGA